MKKQIIFLIIQLVNFSYIYSQSINLVPNSSFEEFTQCPYANGQIYYASPWTAATDTWAGQTGSSDYFNKCSAVLSPIFTYQQPKTGIAYAGIALFSNPIGTDNYREYLEVKLKENLKKDKKYCGEFYISFPDYGSYAISNIGMYFSQTVVVQISLASPLPYIPQIKNTKGILKDTINWIKVNGSFIANGGEKYLVIGNFKDNLHTNYIEVSYGAVSPYYFIDDVSVCECSFDINLGADTTLCEGENLILNPNLPNATYTWQDSSHAATYEVKQPGTYWVRAYVADYDITSTDTIIIKGGDDSFCNPPLTIPNIITPNGDSQNDNFVIQNAATYEIALQIYNRWGNIIYESTNYQNDFNCKDCADGTYFYILKAKSKRNGREKEYKGSLTIIK